VAKITIVERWLILPMSSGSSLGEVLTQYLAQLPAKDKPEAQQELSRFIRWCGRDRKASELTPAEMEDYARLTGDVGTSMSRLSHVKAFLRSLKKSGGVMVSLDTHLKASRSRKAATHRPARQLEEVVLSTEGRLRLQEQLEVLKEGRIRVVEEIQRARADKDFRENAPLDAAKERQGQIEAAIKDIEDVLSRSTSSPVAAQVVEKKVVIGKHVLIKESGSGKTFIYTLVDPREVDPAAGKISVASPVGRALLERREGEVVSVVVPRGTLHYRIEKIEG
jgi:transcription elongation factor GreA